MAKRRTWLWILVGCLAVCVIGVVAIAVALGVFVSNHVSAGRTTSIEAGKAFDQAQAAFKDVRPLFELDQLERPRMTRRLEDLPAASERPRQMWILAWDPDEERLIRMSLPFWVLRLGRQKVNVMRQESGFDLERLDLDMNELERVGPLLVFSHRLNSGERVMIWTK